MTQCPVCQFLNEDGALFCEKCKSDLGGTVAAVAVHEPHSGQHVEAFALKPDNHDSPVAAIPLDAGSVAGPVALAEPLPPGNLFDHTSPMQHVETGRYSSPGAAPSGLLGVKPAAPEAQPKLPIEPSAAPASEMPSPASGAPSVDGDYKLAADAKPRLSVIRGQRIGTEYPIYEGENFIGRTDEKPVDIDLEDQEPPDRIWSSRQHAVITMEDSKLFIEDLSSMNGTFVNRARVHPGQRRSLKPNDIVQIGTVQMKLKV